jgi:UDP-glucose 4-epimerase
MKLFITGATGFIGRAVVKRALQLGHEVRAVSLHGGTVVGHTVRPLNLEDEEGVKCFCSGLEVDAFIHLASRVPISFEYEETRALLVPNVFSTLFALEAALDMRAKRFIFSSSGSLYSLHGGHFSEENPIRPFNFYSTSKYFGELLCEQFTNSGFLSSFWLRISAPYGPSPRRQTVIHKFVTAALKNQNISLWGSGKRSQDFLYIDDLVDAIFLALEKSANGGCNIASGRSVTMRELAEKVIEAVPGCQSKILYSGKPDLQESYCPEYDLTLAKQLIGYRPRVSLEEGLRHLVEHESCQNKGDENRDYI